MPEIPDLTVYMEAIERRFGGQAIEHVRLFSPFVVRSVEPPLTAVEGARLARMRRLGKRLVFELESDPSGEPLFLVVHLMIAGRFHVRKRGAKPTGRTGLAALDFACATLMLTEASSRKRASIHLVRGESALAQLAPGGLEVLDASLEEFSAALCRESHTVKRALTDPRLFSGIGNAYSDEILHRARLSPVKLTSRLEVAEIEVLYEATRATLREWIARLRAEVGDGFPEKVTAFHEEMAVHGRYRKPCPVCGNAVQRICSAENEANYCPTCQTQGKLLADRSLSRLLHDDWPRSLADLEELPNGFLGVRP